VNDVARISEASLKNFSESVLEEEELFVNLFECDLLK